ncbi:MAG: hypothetical protein ABFS12_07730 [Bacteroidota bacterium]
MTNIKNKILLISIAVMVVVSALSASHTPIYWEYFGFSIIVLALLIILQKREIKKEIEHNDFDDFNIKNFKETIEHLTNEVKSISKEIIKDNYTEMLTGKLETYKINIDDYRLTMINQIGVKKYTKISIPFAQAERIINRGMSAAIDGYFEESQNEIRKSIKYLELLQEEIEIIMREING